MDDLDAALGRKNLFVVGTIRELHSEEREYLAALGDPAKPFFVEAQRFPATSARPAVLFALAPGREVGPEDAECCLLGEVVARMHECTADFASPHQRFVLDLHHLLDEPLSVTLPYLSHRPDDQDYLNQFADDLRERVSALATSGELEWGACHGDVQGPTLVSMRTVGLPCSTSTVAAWAGGHTTWRSFAGS